MADDFDKLENKETFYYKISTLYYGIYITQAAISWCQHIRAGKPLADLVAKNKNKKGE